MGAKTLVELNSTLGTKLLEQLDRHRVPVDAAFWFQDDDDQWKLYLHTSLIESQSRTKAYKAIQKALAGLADSVAVQDLNLLRADDPILRAMRVLISTGGQGISTIRLTRSTINGLFIRDALVHRL